MFFSDFLERSSFVFDALSLLCCVLEKGRVIDFYVRTAAPIPLYFLPSALLYRIHLHPYVAVPARIVINIAIQVAASKKDRRY